MDMLLVDGGRYVSQDATIMDQGKEHLRLGIA